MWCLSRGWTGVRRTDTVKLCVSLALETGTHAVAGNLSPTGKSRLTRKIR